MWLCMQLLLGWHKWYDTCAQSSLEIVALVMMLYCCCCHAIRAPCTRACGPSGALSSWFVWWSTSPWHAWTCRTSAWHGSSWTGWCQAGITCATFCKVLDQQVNGSCDGHFNGLSQTTVIAALVLHNQLAKWQPSKHFCKGFAKLVNRLAQQQAVKTSTGCHVPSGRALVCELYSRMMCLPFAPLLVHMQRLVEQFESLMLSAGPGAPEADVRTFPRPVGEERVTAHAPQPPYHEGNCSPDNMRLTVMGVPNSTALRLR